VTISFPILPPEEPVLMYVRLLIRCRYFVDNKQIGAYASASPAGRDGSAVAASRRTHSVGNGNRF